MKLKAFAAAIAAVFLLAGLVFLPGKSEAGHRNGGGGRGHPGGHAFHASGHGNFHFRSANHGFRFRNRAGRIGGSRVHSRHFVKRFSKSPALAGTGKHRLRHLASNRSLRKASFTKRNAFFNKAKFGRDRDHWRDRSGRFYGYRWSGGVFWPYFFGDYFSYAFWPGDYGDSFWGYGPDALLWGAFWPNGYGYGYGGGQGAARGAGAPDASDLAGTCRGFAPGVSDLPMQSLEGIVGPSPEERSALDNLKAAVAKASDVLKQACPAEAPLTPAARLDAMHDRLQSALQAQEIVKVPLERLYGLLTDDQKKRLNALSGHRGRSGGARGGKIAGLCSSQAGFANVPAQEIANALNLTAAQQQKFEALKAASAKASDLLAGSCPASMPETLDGRLDAAQKRVTALIAAVDTVKPAVADFYGSLTDEQKAALAPRKGKAS